jgi:hypothetical protein
MSRHNQQTRLRWTPEEGFDLSFLTIKRMAEVSGASSKGIKHNVESILTLLPIEERVAVMEWMLKSKVKRLKEVEK